MGYTACTMDTKRGNASPVHSQGGPRGQMSLKSSPFCPRSSSRLTQYIIEDHMVSHYRKVYSAKAAIDVSVPKSMLHSVKYHDQLRRDELRTRPQSAQSQRSSSRAGTRASCVSEGQVQGRRSAQGDESAYFCLGSSLLSSPRLNTSFHAKQVVYPSQTLTGSAASPRRPPRSASSEFSYGNPAPQRQHSARSCATTGSGTGQDAYKAFQDPAQKTYSGDLLQKHSGRFTQDKPFTPRTLRSESRSYLSQYRYYTPPRRKADQDGTAPRLTRQETYHGCASAKDCSSPELDDPPQGLGVEHGWSDDEPFNNHSAPEHHSKASRSRNSDLHLPSYRMSPDGMKSPIMRRVSDEEEELRYLEFIADVTNEILLRGLYSDRVLERVFERHVERNKLRLDEDKMRHLLEVLRNDLQSPASTPTCRAVPEPGQGHLPPHRYPQSPDTEVTFDTKEDRDLFAYASFTKDRGELGGAVPLAVSMAIGGRSPDETAGERVQNQEEQHNHSRDSVPLPEENTDPTPTTHDNEEDLRRNPADDRDDGVCGELEELGRTLAESLCVSGGPQGVTQPGNTGASLSDDEF